MVVSSALERTGFETGARPDRIRIWGRNHAQRHGLDGAEILDADVCNEPLDCAWPGWRMKVPLVERDAAGLFDRGNGFALNASAADNPAEEGAEHEHKDDQAAHAEGAEDGATIERSVRQPWSSLYVVGAAVCCTWSLGRVLWSSSTASRVTLVAFNVRLRRRASAFR